MVSQRNVGQHMRGLLKRCSFIEDPTGNLLRMLKNKMHLDDESDTGRIEKMIEKTLLNQEKNGVVKLTRSSDGIIRSITVVEATKEAIIVSESKNPKPDETLKSVEVEVGRAVDEIFESREIDKEEGSVQQHAAPAVMLDPPIEASPDIPSDEDIIRDLLEVGKQHEREKQVALEEKRTAEKLAEEAFDEARKAGLERNKVTAERDAALSALSDANAALAAATARIAELTATVGSRKALAAEVAEFLHRAPGTKVN